MGLDTILVLAMTLVAVLLFVAAEVNSRRNSRMQQSQPKQAGAADSKGSVKESA
jgi:hypothetical protein